MLISKVHYIFDRCLCTYIHQGDDLIKVEVRFRTDNLVLLLMACKYLKVGLCYPASVRETETEIDKKLQTGIPVGNEQH